VCAVRWLALVCAVVVMGGSCDSGTCGGAGAGVGKVGVGCALGNDGASGVMLTCHRHAPAGSRALWSIVLKRLSQMMSLCLSRCAVHSALHSFPKLRRLLVNPGMMCPVRACRVGMVGMARSAEAVDVRVSPVAVHIVVRGASVSTQRSGAVLVK